MADGAMVETTHTLPGTSMVVKPKSTSNRTNCRSSLTSVRGAPHSESGRNKTKSGLSMMAQLLASEWSDAGQGTRQGEAKALMVGSRLERERGAPSTNLTIRGPPMGSKQSKCRRLLNRLRHQAMHM